LSSILEDDTQDSKSFGQSFQYPDQLTYMT